MAITQRTSWTRRRYHPETRAIVSSYQVSADLRKCSIFPATSSVRPSASARRAVSASRTRGTGISRTAFSRRSNDSSTVAATSLVSFSTSRLRRAEITVRDGR